MSQKVDREAALQTATGRLFFANYLCAVPYMHFHSEDFLRATGMMLTGDPVMDAHQANDYVHTMKSPAVLAKYVEADVLIKNISPQDAASIYSDIEEYLNERAVEANHGFDTGQISVEWVQLFEQLKQALAGLASEHWAVQPRPAKKVFKIPGLTLGIGRSDIRPTETPTAEPVLPKETEKLRHPSAISIQEAIHRRGLEAGE